MTIRFRFMHEIGKTKVLTLPPNLLALYHAIVIKKRYNILLSLFCLIICSMVILNSTYRIIPILLEREWRTIFTILLGVSLFFLLNNLLWNGPKSVLIFAVISIEFFDVYINNMLNVMQQMIDPLSATHMFITKKDIKKIEREIVTAQLLKELSAETLQIQDLYTAINLISLSCDSKIHGFYIEKCKNTKVKNGSGR